MTQNNKKIWIISGESSGDVYGARLCSQLQKIATARNVKLEISGMGGEKMRQAGVNILVDSTELGVMGLFEVFKLLFTFVKIYFKLLNLAKLERPNAIVLIDYPGFNLRFAKALYKSHIPVIWYVSPQIWVWGKKRKPILEKICTKMMVLFPFEPEVYDQEKLDVEFVGHPLVDIVEERTDSTLTRDDDLLLLLPGSRAMEVKRLLKPMLETVYELSQSHPNLKFVLSAPREKIAKQCIDQISEFSKSHPSSPVITIERNTPYFLQKATTALAASGTVTVEAAIAGLPVVVVYKMNILTILVALIVVRLYRNSFTIANIILNKTVFEEFLQWHVVPKELVPALERILPGGSRRQQVLDDMAELKTMLAPENTRPSVRAAEACFEVLDRL